MRRFLSITGITLALAMASPSLAKSSQKFKSSVSAPISTAVNVEVLIGEDLAYRANNLPKKLSDRGSSRSLNSGFSGNGFYGDRDLNRLAERLETKMNKRLAKRGVTVDENAATTLRLVITDAKPNRPTFKQLSKEPGLSSRSYGIGGASIEGQILSARGETLGDMSYAWYENDIDYAAFGGTWSDAHRAFDKFAKKAAKSLP